MVRHLFAAVMAVLAGAMTLPGAAALAQESQPTEEALLSPTGIWLVEDSSAVFIFGERNRLAIQGDAERGIPDFRGTYRLQEYGMLPLSNAAGTLRIRALEGDSMTLAGNEVFEGEITLARRIDPIAAVLGTTVAVYLGFTVIFLGFAAFMTGQALARGWQPVWKLLPYCVLLGFANRFLVYSLFSGKLTSPTGAVVDFVVMLAIAFLAFRLTQARKMVSQYPWLYERSGPFGWRPRNQTAVHT